MSFASKLVDIVLVEGGFATLLVFLGLAFFAALYFREKDRNRELTDTILKYSEKHTEKFVDVVTTGIEADNRLAITIGHLSATINDIKMRLDSLAPTQRR